MAAENIKEEVSPSGLTSYTMLDSALLRMHADVELMKAAFSRLLLNAVNFNHRGGSISIFARYEPGQISFVFTDTGGHLN